MGKQTVNSDAVAQDQIKAFVDRILRMRQEAKAIADDIREIYAEARGNGFDKTVLGKIVLHVERSATKADQMAEQDALFDLYLSAYLGTPSRTHAHAREDDDHIADAGKMVGTEPASGGPGGEGGKDAPALSANHSASDGERSDASPGEGRNGVAATAAPDLSSPDPLRSDAATREGAVSGAAVIRFSSKPLRPHCLKTGPGEICGSQGGRVHCGPCERAKSQRINVEAGGTEIPHHGDVA